MRQKFLRRALGSALIAALAAGTSYAADTSRSTSTQKSPASSSSRTTSSRSTSGARGPLPDPALLDGSKEQPEKKSEYGMIGDFELPGDENVRNGRVGGPQNPGQQPPPGGGVALPQMGGGGPQADQSKQAAGAGKQGEQSEQGGGGPDNKDAAGKQVAGAGDPNAKPEGQQVAQLGGEGGPQPQGGPGEKPPPVAIGDSAMRIQTSQAAAGVVGAQQQVQGNTQHHEKGTGSGGKGPTGVQGNNRVEKGRVIPSGL